MILAPGATRATRPATCVPWPKVDVGGSAADFARVGVEVDEVEARQQAAGEHRVCGVDAGVEHRHANAVAADSAWASASRSAAGAHCAV